MSAALKVPTIFTAVDKFSGPLFKMRGSLNEFGNEAESVAARTERRLRGISSKAQNIAMGAGVAATAIIAPLALAANSAMKFEDRMADVAKTTGLEGKALENLSVGILDYSKNTRTSIEELQKIAAIGGQQGILGEQNIIAYTKAVDKFSVALGGDFGGDISTATQAISGLNNLFKETRSLAPEKSITQVGSAMNALSAKGVLVPNLSEFALRVGQLPDAIKPSIQSTLALGAVLDKAKIPAEVSARAYGDFVTGASKNLSKFSAQIGITAQEAENLINTQPEVFLAKFAKSLKGLNAQQISKKLQGLGIADTGTIKLVGALSSNLGMLTEFTKLSNQEFASGTSLLNEYNKVNETAAAKLAKAKNRFEALSITVGNELLPIVAELTETIGPLITGVMKFAKANPIVVKLAVAFGGLLTVISIVAGTIASITTVMALFTGWTIVATVKEWLFAASIWGANAAWKVYVVWTKAVTAAQWLWNAAMTANPIGLIIVGVAALIALIVAVVAKWNEWGAAVSLFLGPIGFVISMIQSFRRNWDMVTEAFSKGGIIEGIKAIGKVLIDAILQPVQQLLTLLSNIPGIGKFAASGASKIASIREGLGVNTTTDESGEPLNAAVNPKKSEQDALVSRMETTQNKSMFLDFKNVPQGTVMGGDTDWVRQVQPNISSTMSR